ncbi:MAG: glucose-1-phosphate adenylyltransferase subunit GlgD [Bacilli bacterium]|jgi:glucose-1-phosphate adenylyltransferase|nr:glucose-1-phosphate adenylyltransferase subunit GlgD [Bacilli bacterium]
MSRQAIGLIDCHNSPSLGGITANRCLASTSFLGRYAFIDFALSNFCNSGIADVGILVKDHQRSVLKHLGNMTAWVTNTKIGRRALFYNENGPLNPACNSDIANIRQNDWVLYDSKADYLVFASAHVILDIDFRPILAEHIARKETVTMVYQKVNNADVAFRHESVLGIDKDGYVESINPNGGRKKNADVSLEIWIVNRPILADLIKKHGQVDPTYGMREMIGYLFRAGKIKIHAHEHKGYARSFDSLAHYMEYSFELLKEAPAKALFRPDWPIYTVTHDTPPALYGREASISNSFVANGCIVEGSVKDSIICRGVKVGKGAKVERSIVFSNVALGADTAISDCVIDKYGIVTKGHKAAGTKESVLYLNQGAIL